MSGSVLAISHRAARQRTGLRARRTLRSAIPLRSPGEIESIRAAGRVVCAAIDAAAARCTPGVTTREVNDAARDALTAAGARSLFLDYPTYVAGDGFPAVTCISVNEEVVHGVPGRRALRRGDVVTIDCGAALAGWCADAARTLPVADVADPVAEMIATAEAVLATAIEVIRPGLLWSDVARVMQSIAEDAGYGIVQGYVGHGIGRALHEPPQVPGFVTRQFLRSGDFTLLPGMVVAIEPMLTLGSPETARLDDGWTVVTADASPACHVEHTIAVTRRGAEVLTASPGRFIAAPEKGMLVHG